MSEQTRAGEPLEGRSAAGLESLMVQYQQANREGAEAVLNALWPLLRRFFLSMRDSRPLADDLAQETLLRVHRVRHTYRPGEPVLPWVYAIARRVRVDNFRKQRSVVAHEEQVETAALEAKAGSETPAFSHDFETLLSAIPESQREVLTMLKVLGMTLEEVARATSSTTGAVKQKAHRAYEKLRQIVDQKRKG